AAGSLRYRNRICGQPAEPCPAPSPSTRFARWERESFSCACPPPSGNLQQDRASQTAIVPAASYRLDDRGQDNDDKQPHGCGGTRIGTLSARPGPDIVICRRHIPGVFCGHVMEWL